jgi:hypothetical protein
MPRLFTPFGGVNLIAQKHDAFLVVGHAYSLGNIRARSSRPSKVPHVRVPQDDGCSVGGPSCLTHQLPQCVFDLPLAERQRLFAEHGLVLRRGLFADVEASGIPHRCEEDVVLVRLSDAAIPASFAPASRTAASGGH